MLFRSDHRDDALQKVAEEDHQGLVASEHRAGVPETGVAVADVAEVRRPGPARHEIGDRYGAEHVADDDGEQDRRHADTL